MLKQTGYTGRLGVAQIPPVAPAHILLPEGSGHLRHQRQAPRLFPNLHPELQFMSYARQVARLSAKPAARFSVLREAGNQTSHATYTKTIDKTLEHSLRIAEFRVSRQGHVVGAVSTDTYISRFTHTDTLEHVIEVAWSLTTAVATSTRFNKVESMAITMANYAPY